MENGTKTSQGTETMIKITPQNKTSKESAAASDLRRPLPLLRNGCRFHHFSCQEEFTTSVLHWILTETSTPLKVWGDIAYWQIPGIALEWQEMTSASPQDL